VAMPASSPARAVAVDLDALGDTQALWRAWLADAARVLELDAATLPEDRAAAARVLDGAGGNWRVLLTRFAEDRAPVYLRPSAEATAALRALAAAGVRVGVFTDAPAELAAVAAAHLGAGRRVEAIEAGAGSLERLAERLEGSPAVVHSRAQLLALTASL
jgi:phosphoglycolate phosphatase-like HAD superfamily hydrolase